MASELAYRTASAGYPTRYQQDQRVTRTEMLLRLARERGLSETYVRKVLCGYRAA